MISADTTTFLLITQTHALGITSEQVSLSHVFRFTCGNLVLLLSLSKMQPLPYTCMDKTPVRVLTIVHLGYFGVTLPRTQMGAMEGHLTQWPFRIISLPTGSWEHAMWETSSLQESLLGVC